MYKKILLIDDDAGEQFCFLEALNDVSAPVKFFAVTNGAEGIKLMKLLKPDLVFLDINMPGLSGFDCLKIIKSDNCISKIPIIIYSTDIDEVVFDSAIKNGAKTCLKKQDTIKDLVYLLNKFFVPDEFSDRMNYSAQLINPK